MVRTQIQITEVQAQQLKELAVRKKKSVAELIRQGIDIILEQQMPLSMEERRQRALQAAGRFHSGVHDLSENHDRYLAEAYAE
ncbi:MAG: CopG family transcriptional regulator [Chloroflexi bacterium]|nr:CopG family transcriptional regulator [Chloroflexota bacterium]